jgi:hypothetical protein
MKTMRTGTVEVHVVGTRDFTQHLDLLHVINYFPVELVVQSAQDGMNGGDPTRSRPSVVKQKIRASD